MGLNEVTSRVAARHAHALVVEVPGWWRTRMVVERSVLERGWQLARSPADADVLIICGTPGRRFTEAVDHAWHQMPGPRVRVQARGTADIADACDEAHRLLLDPDRHRHDALNRPGAEDLLASQSQDRKAEQDHGAHSHHVDQGDVDGPGHRHSDHQNHAGHEEPGETATVAPAREGAKATHPGMGEQQEQMGHGDHHGGVVDAERHDPDAKDHHEGNDDEAGREGHARPEDHGGDEAHSNHEEHGGHHGHASHAGHGDMEMSPSGIPLAEGGADRDGLEMDVLNFRLGPVLPHWPAGLVLHCSLQGDVLTQVRAELLDAADHRSGSDGRARGLDNVVSVLALAGWDDAAAEARRIRDAALGIGDGPGTIRGVERLRRKVRRSWTLRWSLRGLRPLTEDEVGRHGLPADAVGDTYDRLVRMVDRAATSESAGPGRHEARPALSTEHLAQLVVGLDLGAARLVIASLDVHGLRAGHTQHEVTGC